MRLTFLTASFLCGLFLTANHMVGQTWTQTGAPSNSWGFVTCSADGVKVVATSVNGIYCSQDSGMSWLPVTPLATNEYSVACSVDGSKIIVAGLRANPGPIYVSTNYGTTWLQAMAPVTNWYSVASSADGSVLVAVGYSLPNPISKGFAYVSTNSGESWKPCSSLPSQNWFSVSSSADGSSLAVASLNGGPQVFYTSTNFGAIWNAASLRSGGLDSVACSADGATIVTAAQAPYGRSYTSEDSGATWTTNDLPNYSWQSVASSANGTRLTMVSGGYSNYFSGPNLIFVPTPGPIYSSSDSGITWISNNAPTLEWQSVVSSADGSKLYAVEASDGHIYTQQYTPSPQLNLTLSEAFLKFSWILPSTDFAFQENPDIGTTNWVTLTNYPNLNLSNLENEIILAPTRSNAFFRLIAQ